MTVRVGINGFGRIGRSFFRALLARGESAGVELVAVNDPMGDAATMAFLLKHDSVGGTLHNDVQATDSGFKVDGAEILRRFAFDVFNPSVRMLASADGVRREMQRFIDPERGEVRVDAAKRYDAEAQVGREIWYFSTEGEQDFFVVSLELRSIFPQELPLLLDAGSLRLLERYGDFERTPFTAETPHQVCVCEAV